MLTQLSYYFYLINFLSFTLVSSIAASNEETPIDNQPSMKAGPLDNIMPGSGSSTQSPQSQSPISGLPSMPGGLPSPGNGESSQGGAKMILGSFQAIVMPFNPATMGQIAGQMGQLAGQKPPSVPPFG